jgi:hypothetical protein
MPSASTEDGPCPQNDGCIGHTPAEAIPSAALSAASFTEKLVSECDRPARGAAEITKNSVPRTGVCSFQRVCVCLLGESHPGFRKGAGSRGT